MMAATKVPVVQITVDMYIGSMDLSITGSGTKMLICATPNYSMPFNAPKLRHSIANTLPCNLG
jgi:hypothetical protein